MGGSSEEKNLPPSSKKLREARRKGQVPRSKDFVSAIVTLAGFGYVLWQLPAITTRFSGLIEQTGGLELRGFTEARGAVMGQVAQSFVLVVAPLLLFLVLAAIASSVIATGGPALSLEPLMPKLDKLNPAQGVGKLFSLRSLLEVGKSLLKLGFVAAVAIAFIRGSLQAMVELPVCGLDCSGPLLRASLLPLMASGVLIFLVFGAADLLLQRWLFIRDQRMTLTERKNEHKNSEGNPLIRGAHKRERREAGRLRSGLREATFVITGSRIAVAMRYSSSDTRVPMPVARAEADDTVKFVQDARRLKLPIIHDAEAARALFDRVQIGHTIPRELFTPTISCMKRLGVL